MMKFSVSSYIEQHNQVMKSLNLSEIERAVELIREKSLAEKKVAVCGNGGSAMAASHYITDWNKMVHSETGKRFNGVCLSDNIGLLTAYANDLSYEYVFSEQVKNLLLTDDLLITVSGSGNSENVVLATEVANKLGVTTLAICGYDGGKLRQISKHSVWIRSFDMQICEDAHLLFGHVVMKALCGVEVSI